MPAGTKAGKRAHTLEDPSKILRDVEEEDEENGEGGSVFGVMA